MRYDNVTVLVGANATELADEEARLCADVATRGGTLEYVARLAYGVTAYRIGESGA